MDKIRIHKWTLKKQGLSGSTLYRRAAVLMDTNAIKNFQEKTLLILILYVTTRSKVETIPSVPS